MVWGWGVERSRKENKRSLRKPVKKKKNQIKKDLKGPNATR